jgi:hypothetical protein
VRLTGVLPALRRPGGHTDVEALAASALARLEQLPDAERLALAQRLSLQPPATVGTDWRYTGRLRLARTTWRADDPGEVAAAERFQRAAYGFRDDETVAFDDLHYQEMHDYDPTRPREALLALAVWGWMLGVAVARADRARLDDLLAAAFDDAPTMAAGITNGR